MVAWYDAPEALGGPALGLQSRALNTDPEPLCDLAVSDTDSHPTPPTPQEKHIGIEGRPTLEPAGWQVGRVGRPTLRTFPVPRWEMLVSKPLMGRDVLTATPRGL